jgi:hypothetical protein
MIIATFNSAEGNHLNPFKFVDGILSAGTISTKQASALRLSLHGHNPINLHVEKIGRKLWVTLLTHRRSVWTWSIGAGGKATSPHIDTSESDLSATAALNTRA